MEVTCSDSPLQARSIAHSKKTERYMAHARRATLRTVISAMTYSHCNREWLLALFLTLAIWIWCNVCSYCDRGWLAKQAKDTIQRTIAAEEQGTDGCCHVVLSRRWTIISSNRFFSFNERTESYLPKPSPIYTKQQHIFCSCRYGAIDERCTTRV